MLSSIKSARQAGGPRRGPARTPDRAGGGPEQHREQPWAIEVTGLTKRFGAAYAVRELSFTAAYGRVTGFLGPNGAGKTTTLRAILGLVRPDAGQATVAGHTYSRLADPVRSVGALLDAAAVHPGLTARQHLRILAVAASIPLSRAERLLAEAGLSDAADRRVAGYSLGMRQRLGLATALIGDPRVLILDEPANGLDPQGIRWLRNSLRALAAQGRAVLVSSHVLTEVALAADDVIVINGGRSVVQAPLEALLAAYPGRTLEDVYLQLTGMPDGALT
jgi:ABC-2 type transport system ATP-binding protein